MYEDLIDQNRERERKKTPLFFRPIQRKAFSTHRLGIYVFLFQHIVSCQLINLSIQPKENRGPNTKCLGKAHTEAEKPKVESATLLREKQKVV